MKTWKNIFQKLFAVLLAVCLIAGCMQASTVEAATSKSGTTYYYTHLNRQKVGKPVYDGKYKYYETGTTKVTCKGNTLTMYSSFSTSKSMKYESKKSLVKYGKHTFKLTSKTKYFSQEYDPVEIITNHYSKSQFINCMKRLNGLGLWIKVKDGKVISMQFVS